MTAERVPQRPDPLAPLVAALIDRARGDAAALLADADADVAATLASARAQAESIRDEARAKGAADAAAIIEVEQARAERAARESLLVAHRTAEESLREAARYGVCDLRNDDEYRLLLERLRSRAMKELGPCVVITEHPRGGIVAQADGQRVEYSLEALADDVIDRLEAQPERSLTP